MQFSVRIFPSKAINIYVNADPRPLIHSSWLFLVASASMVKRIDLSGRESTGITPRGSNIPHKHVGSHDPARQPPTDSTTVALRSKNLVLRDQPSRRCSLAARLTQDGMGRGPGMMRRGVKCPESTSHLRLMSSSFANRYQKLFREHAGKYLGEARLQANQLVNDCDLSSKPGAVWIRPFTH